MTTVSESAEVHTSIDVRPNVDSNAQTCPPARAKITRQSITDRVRAALPADGDVRRSSPFHSAPASVADVIAYTRSGDWVPGEQARLLEAAGKAYGWIVAVPLSIAAYALVWVLQRPARMLLASIVATVMVLMLPARTFIGGVPAALLVATIVAAATTHNPPKEGTS